ncbi:MAG: hypothetical protein WCQ50_13505, partial [Spirochaetota bacterium]
MRPRNLIYFTLPLVAALVIVVEWGIALLLGPKPDLAYTFTGLDRSSKLLREAARASRVALLHPRPSLEQGLVKGAEQGDEQGLASRGTWSLGLEFWDEGFQPRAEKLPGGGPAFKELELLKDLALAGSSVALGYHAFADTTTEAGRIALADAGGLRMSSWIGAYLLGLEHSGTVSSSLREAWESQNGRPWDLRGDGILLQNIQDGSILVLLRGRELGTGALRVRGAGSDGTYAGWFVVGEALPGAALQASFVMDLLEPGKELLAAAGLPGSFPALVEKDFGKGRIWSLAGDFLGSVQAPQLLGPLPTPMLDKARSLDSPENALAHFQRILVPLVGNILSEPRVLAPARAATAFRSGRHFIERRGADAVWKPWFVQGVDLGASVPGGWATEPPTDEGTWFTALQGIAATGFDSVRVYTLLPPAFYRALVRYNSSSEKNKLWLFQGIWLDEDAPGHDLLDPDWSASALKECLLAVDALHGSATIEPRVGKSWGEYRIDASPWLAAFLVGRELLPEEVEASSRAHPYFMWSGGHFAVTPGHPVEAFLASLADAVQSREASGFGSSRPIGFVSWPTLDPLRHPSEWDRSPSAKAPYHDRSSIDFRTITAGPEESAGFFTAFHIYPNYPDFLIREKAYDIPDPTGMERYGAYLDALLAVLPPVPFLVAEFGLSTGYGTAHIHPEGLDHGGLSEAAQAKTLGLMWNTVAKRGAGGGMVFEWSDEWSKKTWTTEPFMIPSQRHDLWHNAVDPEQNYGIMAWEDAAPLDWHDSGTGLRTAMDSSFFHIEFPATDLGGSEIIEIGVDTVPNAGQGRLDPGGPLSPQGSEFKVWIQREGTLIVSANLSVAAGYDRGSGSLVPRSALDGNYRGISALVNKAIKTREGRNFPELRENGSNLPVDNASGPGLISLDASGLVHVRLPWSRLNFSDPSSGMVLLDGRRKEALIDISIPDSIGTIRVESVGVWVLRQPGGFPGAAGGLSGRAGGLSGRAGGLSGRAGGLSGRAGGLPGRAGGLPG